MGDSLARLLLQQIAILNVIERSVGAIYAPESDKTGITDDLRLMHDAIYSARSNLCQQAEKLGLYEPD